MKEELVTELMKKGIKLLDIQLKKNVDGLAKIIEEFEKSGEDTSEYFTDQLKELFNKFLLNLGSIEMLHSLVSPFYDSQQMTIGSPIPQEVKDAIKESAEDQESESEDEA